MEIDLETVSLSEPALPQGYHWLAWDPSSLTRHALVKYESFRSEVDARVFSCLGNMGGCQRLMQEIVNQKSFLPEATWLIVYQPDADSEPFDCGTIQGVVQSSGMGAVQNVGIVPHHRGLGLGKALVLKSLLGFQKARVRRVYLEVTAENLPAVNLYRSIGFHLARTMYKAVEVAEAHAV